MKSLLRIAGFKTYIVIVLLNAMTDLGHKIILQNTIFKAYEGAELISLTALVNALILLPFIFLFSPSGFLSDKYPKTRVIRYAAAAAIVITLLITAAYYLGWFRAAFFLTLLLAAQSAIYSPAKYGLIKEMTGSDKLAQANAAVQAVTVVAILAGAVIYSIFFESLWNVSADSPSRILQAVAPLGWLLVVSSIAEFVLAQRLAKRIEVNRIDETMHFSPKAYATLHYLKENFGTLMHRRVVWLGIIGLSLVWGIAQIVVAIYGEYLKHRLGITDTVTAQGLLALSGVGMIVGSVWAGRASRNFIEIGLIPLGSLGIVAALLYIPSSSSLFGNALALFSFGLFAALIVVPLNALIQFATPIEELGKIIAGSNFVQNVTMFIALVLTALFGYGNIRSEHLFYFAAFIALASTLYALRTMPQAFVRYLVRLFFSVRYRLDVAGLDHLPVDQGILLLGNHISFLDWAVLQMAYPKQIRFVMDRTYYEKWYFKPFLKFFGVIPISTRASKHALDQIARALQNGDTVALFPEGHISRNGHLDTFRPGYQKAVETLNDDQAVIVPFYLRGLWEDNFSHASGKLKRKRTRDISVTFGETMPIASEAPAVKKAVFELSIQSWQRYAQTLPSIQEAWLKEAKRESDRLCIADSTGVELTKTRFAVATLLMASKLKPLVTGTQNVGIFLPASAGGAIGNMALLTLGKTIVNLNYSSGEASLRHALDVADITHIVASKRFVKKLKDKGFDVSGILERVEVIWLEDIKPTISKLHALSTLALFKLLPVSWLKHLYIRSRAGEDIAAVLFSSGSEGRPKGIALMHRNIMGNIKQIATVLNPDDNDVMLGTLPVFHSFGLTVTTLLPLIEGIPVVCHPDPTDGFGIGKMAAKYRATMLFGTATFLRLYTRNRKLHPLMFKDLRLVVAGAEKLPEATRLVFKEKFGKEIYEGYGATETTPVASVNLDDVLLLDEWRVQKGHKPGTVGLPLPGSAFRIVDPDTFEELPVGSEGMILIGGTQIMKGYLKDPDKTDAVIKTIDGIRWYVTGDKGRLDEEGFLTIVDRYSRFAKIGGEMVSLGLVESEIAKLLTPEERIAVTALPDAKKGECVVLLYEGERDIEALKKEIGDLKLNPLFVPSYYYKVDAVPLLGSGKADFKGAKKLAESLRDDR